MITNINTLKSNNRDCIQGNLALKKNYKISSFNTHRLKETFYKTEPETAINWDLNTSLANLKKVIGKERFDALLSKKTINSPASKTANTEWLKNSKIVGINPRAMGSYWNIVKYAMTFPEDSIHMLPLFDQGCTGSLYAPLNWKLSPEFMDKDLTKLGFDTPEKQLKLTINALHALGKNVGMDFLQHTDRFSEEVFINPNYFDWIKLNKEKTKQLMAPDIIPDKTGEEVKSVIQRFIHQNGSATGEKLSQYSIERLFDKNTPENIRQKIIIGNGDISTRNKRRIDLMNYIREAGFETKPTHIDSPLTPIYFDKIQHNDSANWASFKDNLSNNFFGNLTPYKLYHLDNNGCIDKSNPNTETWKSICNHVKDFQMKFNFDFLRADMGYLDYEDDSRDIHAAIKKAVQEENNVPHFASFGECFFSNSIENSKSLLKKNYDALLGDIHYQHVFDGAFLDKIKQYNFNPDHKISITSITADSDQAPYNHLYDNMQNQIRTFFGLFLNQPSYTGMGIETREINPTQGKNLTKDFINDWGIPKYEWGKNKEFFNIFSSMRNTYANISSTIKKQCHYWLNSSEQNVASWLYYSSENKTPSYMFVVNSTKDNKKSVDIQNIFDTNFAKDIDKKIEHFSINGIYSTDKLKKLDASIIFKNKPCRITNLAPGECRIYRVIKSAIK